MPWARAMHELQTGKVDLLFPAGRNAERLEYTDCSEEPANAVNFLVGIDDRKMSGRRCGYTELYESTSVIAA